MTPMGMGNPSNSVSGNSNMLNTISSQGMPQTNSMEESQESTGSNPAEQFIATFGQAFQSVKSLLENPSYSFANKEADLVKRSLQNYLEAVVTGLSVQNKEGASQGGELMGNPSY